jgi:uncharacterized membrane protein YfcA
MVLFATASSYVAARLAAGISASGLHTAFAIFLVVLALYFGLPKKTRAQGMALALVVPSALVALVAYAQGGNVSWATGLPMALGGVLSVSWGVALAHRLPAARLRVLFCLVLLGTAAGMLLAPH